MSDRIKGLTVILEKSFRDDDIESLVKAISHMRGVLKVTNIIEKHDDIFAQLKAKRELMDKIIGVLRD